MKYNEADPQYLLRQNLTLDPEFLEDASTFLYQTEGIVVSDPEEIYDAYMEHMRFSDVNEATTIRDLAVIRDSSDEMKEKYARLYHTYDKMNVFREDEDFSDAITRFGDYAEGILTAPSTYLGILTGGLAKGTAVAGQQVAKAAVRQQLISSITKRGILAGAATEGAIGVGQGDIQERIKVELFPEYEYDVGSVALQGGLSTLPGGVFGGLSARKGAKQAVRAERIGQIGAERVARKNLAATQAAEETIRAADDVKKRQISQILVGAGEEVRTEKLPQSEYLLTQLDDSTQIRIQAAAIELGTSLKPIKFADGTTERITETIARGIADGSISARNFDEIMTKYNLTSPQLALLFTADVSRAARTLQRASQVARVRKMAEAIARQSGTSVDEGDLARAIRGGFSQSDLDEMSLYKNITKAFEEGFMGFEQMRRGLMTTQLQTTQRNIAGGGMRVFLDEVENLFSAGSRQIGEALGMPVSEITQPSKITPPSMIKYLWNQSEAELIAKVYSSAMPKEATRLFAEFVDVADTQALSGVGGAMANFGRKLNFLNKHADNFYKKAIFAGQLDRLTRSKFGKSVADMLAEGEMDKIPIEMYRNATEKAYSLLYQKTPSTKTELGKFANAYLRLDKQAGIGMVTGLVMPFPRFIFNQLEFFAERAPIIGLAFTKGQGAADQGVKQLSGLGMIAGFAVYRATQGPDTKWYNHTNEKGETTNLAPMLAGLTPFLYMGDVLYRAMSEKTEIPSGSKMLDDLQSVLVGEGFRTGASKTLFDRTIPEAFRAFTTGEEVSIRVAEEAGKILGDYAATLMYNLPSGLARDGYGLYNDEARMIIETNGEIRLWDAFMMRFTRGLPAFVRDPILEYYDPNIELLSRPVIEKSDNTKVQIPLSTSITGMNIQAPESALEKEFNRLGMTTYDVYKPHPFGPADVMLRERLGDRLNEEAQAVMATDLYKQYEDSGKRRMMKKRLSAVVNSERAIVFDALRERVRTGQEKRFSEEDLEKFKFESTGTSDDRRQAKAEFRKKYEKDREYDFAAPGDYAKLNDELEVLLKELNAVRKAYGGLVQKFNVGGMPTPMDEQMDALSLSETLEEQQAPDVSVGEYLGMLGDLRRGITGGAMTGQADMVKFIDDAIDYVRGQDADLDAPLTQLTDATLGKYGREITGDSEIAQASSKLIGENLGVIESIAPGFKILGNTLPDTLGIFVPAKKAADKNKRYEELMSKPLRKGETEADRAERVRQETNIGAIEGLDDAPRLEIDDYSVPLNAVRKKDPFTDKEVFFGIDGLPLGHPNSKLTMGDVFPHEDLFKYYPEARNIPIIKQEGKGGSFSLPHKGESAAIEFGEDIETENKLKETLIHELQHFVQWSERLNAGGNQTAFTLKGLDNIEAVLSEAGKRLHQIDAIQDGLRNASQGYAVGYGDTAWEAFRNRILKPLRSNDPDEVERKQKEIKRWFGDELANDLIEYSKFGREYEKLQQEPFRRYMLLAGEVEARMTGNRIFMSPARRKQVKPDVTDVLKSDELRYSEVDKPFRYDNYDIDQLIQARHRPIGSDSWSFAFGGAYRDAIRSSEKKATDLIDRMRESKAIDLSNDTNVLLGEARTSIQKDSMNKRSYLYTMEGLDSPQAPDINSRADLWDAPDQQITSADTSINKEKLPAGYGKLKKLGVFKPGQRVVDIGGGRFDNAVEDLAKQDVELLVYDPFNRTPEHNKAVADVIADGGADVAVSNNVLNVIEEPENIKRVIEQAENAIKPGDKAYFTVYAGNRSGKGAQTTKGYQRNEPTSAYVSRVEEVFGEGNVQSKGDLITATKASKLYKVNNKGQSIHSTSDGVKNFNNWFKESQIKSLDDNPLVVYHGTSKDKDFPSFKKSNRGNWFIADPSKASQYAIENDSMNLRWTDSGTLEEVNTASRVIPVYLSIKNPYISTIDNWQKDWMKGAENYARRESEVMSQLERQGYDGVVLKLSEDSPMEESMFVTFSPQQIKSAVSNTGKYSEKAPAINKNRGGLMSRK